LVWAPEGAPVDVGEAVSGDRERCTAILHAGAGPSLSTLAVTLDAWSEGPVRVEVLDLLGAPIVPAASLEVGEPLEFQLARAGEFFLVVQPEDPDVDANSYTLSLSCVANCEREYTRYPVVFLHGMFGTDSWLGLLEYWYEVLPTLEAQGFLAFTPTADGLEGVIPRSNQWKTELDAMVAAGVARRFHIIGHSQGGLDGRYVATHLDPEGRIFSLTTVATPHHGALIADIVDGALDLTPFDALLADAAIDAIVGFLGVEGPSFSAQMEDLSTEALEDFNRDVPDRPDIRYFSWSGRTCAVLDFSCQRDNNGEIVEAWMIPTHSITLAFQGENDGLVGVESAIWGEYLGVLSADHIDEIGQVADSDNPAFEHRDFYLTEVRRLRTIEP
jgi:triacylglycerol lipase